MRFFLSLKQIIFKQLLWLYYAATKVSLVTQILILYFQIKNGYFLWTIFALPIILWEKIVSAKYLLHCIQLFPFVKNILKMILLESFFVIDLMSFFQKNVITFDNLMIKCKIQNTFSALQSMFLFFWLIFTGQQDYMLSYCLISLSSFTVLILNSKNIDSEYFFEYYPDIEEMLKIIIDLSNSISYIGLMIIYSLKIENFVHFLVCFILLENILLVMTLKKDVNRPFCCHIYLSRFISWALFFIDSWANSLSDMRIAILSKHSYDYRGFQAFKFWKLVSCFKLSKCLIALFTYYKYFYQTNQASQAANIDIFAQTFILIQLINLIYQSYWNYIFVLEPMINGGKFIQIKSIQQLNHYNSISQQKEKKLKNLLFTEIKVPNNQQDYQTIVFTLLFQFNKSVIYTQFSCERVKIRKQDPKNNSMIVILTKELSIQNLQQYLAQGYVINPYIKQIDFGLYFLNLQKSLQICRFFSKNDIYIQLFSIHNTVFQVQQQYLNLRIQLLMNCFIKKKFFQKYLFNNYTQVVYDLID
ncbi:hypothetical protein ABPG74_002811 [Tetrahymena malaccensis]